VLAEAGLLDGGPATSHWGDLARLEREYPRVDWRRGVRWIDRGNLVTSAGITSGIDATLRLLVRLEGEDLARRVASELRYPNFHYALRPDAEQYVPRLSDAVLFLNAAFMPMRQELGLALYEGVGELDVSAVYDAHAAAGVANVRALTVDEGVIQTAHGLWLEPTHVASDAVEIEPLDRLIVPGREARTRAAAVVARLHEVEAPAPEYLHDEEAKRFTLEPVLEDLARSANLPTATFARRRLEYRSSSLRLEGATLPIAALLSPLLLGVAGALLVGALAKRRGRRRARLLLTV
jgi:putative intracellular protease/amidase